MIGGYYSLPNPFLRSRPGATDTVDVSVDLVLEQSSYGDMTNPKEALATAWILGPIVAVGTSGPFGGMVQWRAAIRWDALKPTQAAIGIGICAGHLRDLDRRTALLQANRLALWNLVYDMAEVLNKGLSLGLKRTIVRLNAQEYTALVDHGW